MKDDAISRQAAIEAVSKGCQEWRGIFGRCEENILALPSAQPETAERTTEMAQNVSDGDLISRKAAMNRIDEALARVFKEPCGELILRKVPSAQPEQRWIPCSERLPFVEYGESDNVLTTCGYRDVKDTSVRWIRLLYFNGGNWCYPTGKTYEQKVYAWMPLPEPYKGG